MTLRFELLGTDGAARRGRLHTAHGIVETPVFMAVGTQASVKGLTPPQLHEAGVAVVLGNTYHLTLRPGDELIAELGGLHRFMDWQRPILTDSGGFQVYSLAANLKIDDRAAVFRSHIDGSLLELSPERAVRIQENLGADIAMCLDECPPADAGDDRSGGRTPVRRTIALGGALPQASTPPRADQALFAIVQGGTDVELRARCAEALTNIGFDGYALGGFSVGETTQQMVTALAPIRGPLCPPIGRATDGRGPAAKTFSCRGRRPAGVDMFDCVLPTRNGRNACAFTADGHAAGCAIPVTSEMRPRWSPIAHVRRAGSSAGRTSITCSWRRKCWAQPCCRCTTWRTTIACWPTIFCRAIEKGRYARVLREPALPAGAQDFNIIPLTQRHGRPWQGFRAGFAQLPRLIGRGLLAYALCTCFSCLLTAPKVAEESEPKTLRSSGAGRPAGIIFEQIPLLLLLAAIGRSMFFLIFVHRAEGSAARRSSNAKRC